MSALNSCPKQEIRDRPLRPLGKQTRIGRTSKKRPSVKITSVKTEPYIYNYCQTRRLLLILTLMHYSASLAPNRLRPISLRPGSSDCYAGAGLYILILIGVCAVLAFAILGSFFARQMAIRKNDDNRRGVSQSCPFTHSG